MSGLISTRPAPAEALPWSFPDVERQHLAGVEVIGCHLPGQPIVSVGVIADAGAVTDPSGLEGLATATVTTMLKGAAGLDEEGLAIAFETVGASPGGGVQLDHARIGVSAPAGLISDAAKLLAEAVRRPTLDAAEFDKVRATTQDSVKAARSQATYLADIDARREFWKPGTRYRIPARGDRTTLATLNIEAAREYHAARWASAPVHVIVVGDLSGLDLAEIGGHFSVEGAEVPRGVTTVEPIGTGRRITLRAVPGAVQSVLNITAPGPAREIDEAPALAVAQAVVLASFTSRINQRLREDLGYTYGARGAFNRQRDGGDMSVSTQVRTEVTVDAVREIIELLEAVGQDGLRDDEVEQARANIVSQFPVRYDGASSVSAALVQRVVHDRDDNERDEMLAKLRDVTTADATAAWRQYADLDQMVITIAGDADAVREGLQGLNFGPLVEYTD